MRALLPLLLVLAALAAPGANVAPEWWPDWTSSYVCTDEIGGRVVRWYVVPADEWQERYLEGFQVDMTDGSAAIAIREGEVSPRVVAHELGHALGLKHTWKPTTMNNLLPWTVDAEGLTKFPTCIL